MKSAVLEKLGYVKKYSSLPYITSANFSFFPLLIDLVVGERQDYHRLYPPHKRLWSAYPPSLRCTRLHPRTQRAHFHRPPLLRRLPTIFCPALSLFRLVPYPFSLPKSSLVSYSSYFIIMLNANSCPICCLLQHFSFIVETGQTVRTLYS